MAQTYLQIVNSVLTRIRETNAVSVSDSKDTLLIGEFVNEAKEWTEDAHDWSILRTSIQVTTIGDGTYEYSLTGAGSRSTIMQVINDTTDYEFPDAAPWREMNLRLTDSDQENQEPDSWDVNGLDVNGDLIINLAPRPDAVYDINFNLIVPQAPLSVDTTELLVPHTPVTLYANALAVEERGEEGGVSAAVLFQRAHDALDRAVTIDKVTVFDEYVWEIT